MRSFIVFAVAALSLSFGGCSRPNQEALAQLLLSPPPPHPTKAKSLKSPKRLARTFPERKRVIFVKQSSLPTRKPKVHSLPLSNSGIAAETEASPPSPSNPSAAGETQVPPQSSPSTASEAEVQSPSPPSSVRTVGETGAPPPSSPSTASEAEVQSPSPPSSVRTVGATGAPPPSSPSDAGETPPNSPSAVSETEAPSPSNPSDAGTAPPSSPTTSGDIEAPPPPSSPSTAGGAEAPSPPPNSPAASGEAEVESPPPDSPSTSASPSAVGTFYVVRDLAGNCAVVDYKPSVSSGLKIIDWKDYAECEEVVEKEALIGAVEPGAEANLKAARAKAEKLGGVDKLTPEDVKGLSAEQLKQLRGD